MKQNELLKNSLPLIAAGLGDKFGIRVTVSGNQAWTDAKTINIPDFNISSKEEKNAVLGFMSHEAAHIKFDSFRGLNLNGFKNGLHKSMWNIFEDLRIEKAMIADMIGTEKWINQIWINRQKSGTRQPVTSESNPASIIVDYLLFHCRVNYRKQTHLQPYLDAAEDAFIDVLSWKLLMQLKTCIDSKLGSLASSVDAFNLATKVESLISNFEPEEDEPEQNEPNSQEESSSSESDSDGDDEQGSGETDNSDEEGDNSTSDSNPGSDEEQGEEEGQNGGNSESGDADDDQDGESESGQNGTGDDTQSGQQGSSSCDVAFGEEGQQVDAQQVLAAIAAALSATDGDLPDDMAQFAAQMETLANANPIPSVAPMPKSILPAALGGSGADMTRKVKKTSNALTAKLSGLVQENMRVRAKTSTCGTHLDNQVLYRPSVNDARIFKSKTIKKEIDTIVEIQMDNSGSMVIHREDLLKVAKEAQLALAIALSRINGVSVTASAFPTDRTEYDVLNLMNEGESIKTLADRQIHAGGMGAGTPSASALWHSIRKVMSSNRSRKVILFITDGYPDADQREELIRLVHRASRNGVIVVGIAIGDVSREPDSFKQYFNNALFIQDIADLKKEIFKVAQDILLS